MTKILLTVSAIALLGFSVYASGFGGVGIDGTPLENGEILVRQLVAGGPAHLAGIKPGDVITRIDGTETAGSNFKKIVAEGLRGQPGSLVTLTIRRSPRTNPLLFTLTRRELVVENN